MEEETDNRAELLQGASSSAGGGEYSGTDATEEGPAELVRQRTSVTYSANLGGNEENNEASGWIREDTSSCVIVVVTFWFFVSMTLILGVFGTVHFQLGPNSSLLIRPNPLFVDHIMVEQVDYPVTGPMLYDLQVRTNSSFVVRPGPFLVNHRMVELVDDAVTVPMLYDFYNEPPLDVTTSWSESHNASLVANCHKEWTFYLNVGSQINISYKVESTSSSSLILIVAQGPEGFAQWLEDPSYPNTTLAWKIIHGKGLVQQTISKSSNYYIGVANLNLELVEVQLNLSFRASVYNTTEAYYQCPLGHSKCSMKLFLSNGNAAVLTTPALKQGTYEDQWYIRLSYGPRWITYLAGTAGMTALVLLAFNFLNKFGCLREGRPGPYESGSGRAPLLSRKDNDLSSWGSSDDCLSDDEEDMEEGLLSRDGKPLKDGEYNSNVRRLCAICFDAPRDCFFLPCGHCVSCFACGRRIAEAAGTCPICRRHMKKVRRIYTV